MAELVDTKSATAKASDILQGETAYVKSGMVTGTISMQAGSIVVPGTASKTVVERGKYMVSDIVMAGDANLKPENIKKDVTMFGVKGTWEGEPPPPRLPEGFYEIDVQSSNQEAGNAIGGGIASKGMSITVNAEANEADDFYFSEWNENGETVSREDSYKFQVVGGRNLIAKFLKRNYVFNMDWEQSSLRGVMSPAWKGLSYGNGIWVAVGTAAGNCYSYDGKTWSDSTIPFYNCYGIAYGNGKFVTVYNNTNNYAYSTDGINWTSAKMPATRNYSGISFAGGKFFAVTNSSGVAYYSEDGIMWSEINFGFSANWRKVVYGNGKYIALTYGSGANPDDFVYSEDGVTWSGGGKLPSTTYNRYWHDIIYVNGKFIAVSSSTTAPNIAYSQDGITWESIDSPAGMIYGITYGNGRFVAPIFKSGNVIYSADGISWETASLPSSSSWSYISYGRGMFVTIAGGENVAACTNREKVMDNGRI